MGPDCAAELALNVDRKTGSPLTEDTISAWVDGHRWDAVYLDRNVPGGERTEALWARDVHGGKVLSDLFSQLSETRVTYDKVEHGLRLTETIIAQHPEAFEEVAKLLDELIP